jgi:AraC-like DNA-binding protein
MYREHSISPALRNIAACTWQQTAAHAAPARIVPDACVDIVWNGTSLHVAGPDTKPVQLALPANTRIVGLRFVPGTASALLGVPLTAVRDARVALAELWADDAHVLEAQLQAAPDLERARAAIEAAVSARLQASPKLDPLAQAVACSLQRAQRPSVAQLSAALGVSERQLLRRCDAAFGYGPKLLARVLRFQAFLQALREGSELDLAELAVALGYTDQAHLSHETAELGGQTPSQLRERWAR